MEKDIILKLQRKFFSKKSCGWTIGELTAGIKKWFTCEDEFRLIKVRGETRLKAGIWELVINTTGGKNVKYKKLFPDMHVGMIEILTPDFDNTYIHIGNDEKDTEGCPLVGMSINKVGGKPIGTINESTKAYKEMYQIVIKKLLDAKAQGKKVYIEIIDTGEVEV